MLDLRLGVITDVHADLHGLESALRHMRRLRCEAIVCAGDVVDLGYFPQEVIDLLRREEIPTIRGNHDRWALGEGSAHDPSSPGSNGQYDASGFDLAPDALAFLGGLPTSWRAVLHGVRVAVWHSRPGDSTAMLGVYPDQLDAKSAAALLDAAAADVLVLGHTHLTFEVRLADGRRIVNPGALWRDPDPECAPRALVIDPNGSRDAERPVGGRFGLLELPRMRFSVREAESGDLVEHQVVELGSALDPVARRAQGLASTRE